MSDYHYQTYRVLPIYVAVPATTDEETVMDTITQIMAPLVNDERIADYRVVVAGANTVIKAEDEQMAEVFAKSIELDSLAAIRQVIASDERGNHLFSSSENNRFAFYKELAKDVYWQVLFTPQSYPSLDSGIALLSEEQLRARILDEHDGWFVHKTQFDGIATGNYVDSEREQALP